MSKQYALITGASSGIGEAIARQPVQENWNVILVARRTNLLNQVKAALQQLNSHVDIVTPGLSKITELPDFYHRVSQQYDIALWDNNAGFDKTEPVTSLGLKTAEAMVKTNTTAVMEEAFKAGKAKSSGLSNVNIKQTQQILDNFATKPVVDEIETHLYLQEGKMHKFLTDHHIVPESYTPFDERVSMMTKLKPVRAIAKAHAKTPAQIILRFLIQSQVMFNAHSTNPRHMRDNFNVFDFQLTNDKMRQ